MAIKSIRAGISRVKNHLSLVKKELEMNPDVLVPGPGDEVLTRKGMTLDRQVFKEMRREFYELRGWNPDTGEQPTGSTVSGVSSPRSPLHSFNLEGE